MRDEIRQQERDEAERKSRERHGEELRQKDEAHALQVRELEEKLNRVNSQLDEARRKGTRGGGRKRASLSRTCSRRNCGAASPPTRSP